MKTTAARPIESATPATLLWCALGLLVPRATLFGELTPFGVGLAACAGAANLPTLLCLTVGYLLAQPSFLPLRYVVTVAMVGGIRWVLGALPELSGRRFVPPLVAFCACAGTGLVMLRGSGIDGYRVLLILAESAVAAGSTLFLDTAMEMVRTRRHGMVTPGGQAAVILTGAVAVMAAATVEVGGFAPGRAVAAFLVLVLARSGRETGGSMAGCILGGAMALSAPGQTPLAVALAFGGLMAGLFSRYGRVVQTVLFWLAAGVVSLGAVDVVSLSSVYEWLAAGVLFMLLPSAWDRRLCRLFIRSRDLPAVEGLRRLAALQLRVASDAVEEVGRSVEEVSRSLMRYRPPSETVEDPAPRQAVLGQLAGTGMLLRGLASRLEDPRRVDVELSGRVLTLCEDFGIPVVEALCTRDEGNRLTVEILTRDGAPALGGRWLRQMHAVCGRTFGPPVTSVWGAQTRITLREPPRYRVESGLSQLRCGTEKFCGDTARIETLGDGVLVVLSDGMGSGGRAAVDSAMAAGVTARLWQAGLDPAAILQTVHAALLVKDREESAATLDVAVVDPHSGRLDSYKAGAAATLLKSGGRVSRLERPGLPVGILSEARFEHCHDLLSDGDVLLMLSDGALAGGMAPVEELLRDYPAERSMQDLAEAVTSAARAAEGEHSDDITAVALRLYRPDGEPGDL